jgi:hypothetical protein
MRRRTTPTIIVGLGTAALLAGLLTGPGASAAPPATAGGAPTSAASTTPLYLDSQNLTLLKGAISGARLTRPASVDGQLKLNPTGRLPRMTEQQALDLWSTTHGSYGTGWVMAFHAQATVWTPIGYPFRTTPNTPLQMQLVPAWVIVQYAGGDAETACAAVEVLNPPRPGPGMSRGQQREIALIADDGSGLGVDYFTRGYTRCGYTYEGSRVLARFESIPWTYTGHTKMKNAPSWTIDTFDWTYPRCGDLGAYRPILRGTGASATYAVVSDVYMVGNGRSCRLPSKPPAQWAFDIEVGTRPTAWGPPGPDELGPWRHVLYDNGSGKWEYRIWDVYDGT